MKNKLVSIIIPYYNSSVFLLRKAIQSCLTQTYPHLEIIVMIDGSPQDLSSLVSSFSSHKNLHFQFSHKNLGVSTMRNRGLELAKGEFIQFVDADDWIEPDMTEKMVSALRDADLAICGVDGELAECENGIFDSQVFFSFPYRFCWIQYTNYVWNKLFRADIIRKHHIRFKQSIPLGEDAIFCQTYFQYVQYIRCIEDRLYHYIKNGQSATVHYDKNFYQYEFQVIQAITKNFQCYPLCPAEQTYLQSWRLTKAYLVLEYYYRNFKRGELTKHQLLSIYHTIFRTLKLSAQSRSWPRDQKLNYAWQKTLRRATTSPTSAYRQFKLNERHRR